jgi:hypothetical protein
VFIVLDVLDEVLTGSDEGILKSESVRLLQGGNLAMGSTQLYQ